MLATECTAQIDQSNWIHGQKNELYIFELQYHFVWSDSADDRTKVE